MPADRLRPVFPLLCAALVLGLSGCKQSADATAPALAAVDPDPLTALGHRWLAPAGGESADAAWLAHRLALGVPEGRDELGDSDLVSGHKLWLRPIRAHLFAAT